MSADDKLLRALLLEKYEPIAIVGVGLRFPGGATTLDEFETFLRAGECGTGPIPGDRWDVERYFESAPATRGKTSVRGGGFLDGIDQFDAPFFNLSPKEAQYVDPQHRQALEASWEALENAGIDPTALRGSSGGVYFGISCFDYVLETSALADEELNAYVGTGTAHSAVPGRISYLLGWRGPSIAIDTACSSSLVALDLAVTGLRKGDCKIAICGGVNVIHHQLNHIVFSQAGMLSPDGRCKTFDDSADGYARSEGCGVLILKRFSDAKRDGDRILALIRGTAVRQDGESGGLTVPNSLAQEAVMRAALQNSSLHPADIQYVEAHGTGTSLGDPIEMASITRVFSESHTTANPVVVGSLKTNLGHMEAAAGVGGIIKTALQLHQAQVYPHLHLDTPSSRIPWSTSPVTIPTRGSPWRAPVRRAIVNSFGFAGTIASAVLEQAPAQHDLAAPERPADDSEVLVLSAKSEKALHLQAGKYLEFLRENPGMPLRDIAYTAAVGRAHFDHRLAGVVRDHDELADLLALQTDSMAGDPPKVAMLFTGQGAQYPGMGGALYERYPVFREHLDKCDQLFTPHLGRSIRDIILGPDACDEIHQTRFTQPALFAVEYAAAKLWMSWGIEPSVLIGHSIGEVVAAAVAGLFSVADAVQLVAARSSLMQSVSAPGGMVSVQAGREALAPLVARYPDAAFAALNAPDLCVLSGGRDSLNEIVTKLTERGLVTKPLNVSHAFHSPLMAEVLEEFAASIANTAFREPNITLISDVTGQVATFEEVATPQYWVRHLRSPVNFVAGMQAIAERGRHLFLEVGPTATLLGLGRRCVDSGEHAWLATMGPQDQAADVVKDSVAKMYEAGLRLSWADYYRGRAGRRTTLPTYAFHRRRHWLPAGRQPAGLTTTSHPLLGKDISDSARRAEGAREFLATVNADQPGYLRDHVVFGQVVVPATGYLELLLAVQDAVFGETRRPLLDIDIHEPLMLSDEHDVEVLTRLREAADGRAHVEISSRVAGQPGAIERRHVTAWIGTEDELVSELAESSAALQAAATQDMPEADIFSIEDLYARFDELGLSYGKEFQRITSLRRQGEGVAVALLRGHDTGLTEYLPAFLLDNAGQSLACLLTEDETYLPVRFASAQWLRKPKGRVLQSLLRLTGDDSDRGEKTADLLLLDADRPVVIVRGLRLKRVSAKPDEQAGRLFHQLRWVKRSLLRTAPGGHRDIVVVDCEANRYERLTAQLTVSGAQLSHASNASEASALLAGRRPTDVWWFWSADPGPTTAASLRAECERNYQDLLALLRVLQGNDDGQDQRLWLVTEHAQLLPGDQPSEQPSLAAASLWGFGRSLSNENPNHRVTLIDLPEGDYGPLLEECQAADTDELQIAYRNGKRHVLRVYPNRQPRSDDENFELAIPNPGEFADIKRAIIPDRAPEGSEVQVQIHAAGLNFKDVLNALGMLRQHAEHTGVEYVPLPLGFEGAGTVLSAGPDATFATGDEVMISHPGCLRKRVVVPSAVLIRKPANLSMAEAAGLPNAFITAHYALLTLAGLQAGDRVLIHAAAGGVGQAAIALAKAVGAEIFATASPAKHLFLRAQGIEHVLNSRTMEFAREIMERTGGAGVDIVLNSLNNEYIPAGLRTLAPGGRFVELGKIGVWPPERVREVRQDITYHNFDLNELPGPELQEISKRALETTAALLEQGSIAPIAVTLYSLDEIEEAFGVLSRGANIGKMVVDLREATAIAPRPALTLSPDETYLITGGLGALGLVTARKLVDEGARHLSIVSRNAVDEAVLARVHEFLGSDVQLVLHRGDVSDAGDVDRIMAAIACGERPLGGVVHAAGILADGPVSSMTWEQIDHVFQAKVYGTWLLHQAVAGCAGLRFFVGYSSIASMLGPAGQANYAAANAFIDALMSWRTARHQLGQAIGWGPWTEVGMAADLSAQQIKGIEGHGLKFIKPRVGAGALWKVLGQPIGHVTIGEVDWEQFVAQRRTGSALYHQVARGSRAMDDQLDLKALAALPRVARRAAINERVRARIAVLLHLADPSEISPHARFTDLGMDSLTSVEMKNALESMFQTSLPGTVMFDHPTINLLSEALDERLTPKADPAGTAGSSGPQADDPKALKTLTHQDIDAELAALRAGDG